MQKRGKASTRNRHHYWSISKPIVAQTPPKKLTSKTNVENDSEVRGRRRVEGSAPRAGPEPVTGSATVQGRFTCAVLRVVGARRDPRTSEPGPMACPGRPCHHGSRGGPSPPTSRARCEARCATGAQPATGAPGLAPPGGGRAPWTRPRRAARRTPSSGVRTALKGTSAARRRGTGCRRPRAPLRRSSPSGRVGVRASARVAGERRTLVHRARAFASVFRSCSGAPHLRAAPHACGVTAGTRGRSRPCRPPGPEPCVCSVRVRAVCACSVYRVCGVSVVCVHVVCV